MNLLIQETTQNTFQKDHIKKKIVLLKIVFCISSVFDNAMLPFSYQKKKLNSLPLESV